MKKKRGRPLGKKFPLPHTTAEGFDIATHGKVGGTDAMGLIRDCPYPTINFIKGIKAEYRGQTEKKFLRWAPKFEATWALEIGPIVGQRIASGDGDFFRQLADAVESFSRVQGTVESRRRYLAIAHKCACDGQGIPFTRKGLRDYYKSRCPGEKIDSSTLSKIFKWARSANPTNEGIIQEFGPPRRRLGPENPIL